MHEQRLHALLAALMGEGVSVEQIEVAVARAVSIPPGRSISELSRHPDPQLVRAFTHEQARLLERA